MVSKTIGAGSIPVAPAKKKKRGVLNAKKFREMADMFWENNNDKIADILNEVQEAAKNGCYSVIVAKDRVLNERVVERLKRLGLTVECLSSEGVVHKYRISFLTTEE